MTTRANDLLNIDAAIWAIRERKFDENSDSERFRARKIKRRISLACVR